MMTDGISDEGFVDGLSKMLGLDSDAINDLLSKLDVEKILNLIFAVEHGDRKTAEAIVNSVSVEEDEDEDEHKILKDEPKVRSKKENDAGEDYDDIKYNIGDKVDVDGEEATIKIPNAPGDTVGVTIGGKLKMVDRKEISLKESVLGMSCMPDISRIRELAGIMEPEAVECERVQTVSTEEPESVCMAALQQLEQALPAVRLADLKIIRRRINEIVSKMNESFAPNKTVVESRKPRR